jgi:hypothetical protein
MLDHWRFGFKTDELDRSVRMPPLSSCKEALPDLLLEMALSKITWAAFQCTGCVRLWLPKISPGAGADVAMGYPDGGMGNLLKLLGGLFKADLLDRSENRYHPPQASVSARESRFSVRLRFRRLQPLRGRRFRPEGLASSAISAIVAESARQGV